MLNECLIVAENLHKNGSKSWSSDVHKIFSLFNVKVSENLGQINIPELKKQIYSQFRNFWTNSLQNMQGKLRTYAKFKTDFVMEKYVRETPFSLRANYTRFRISAHNLAIETGRHTRPITPVEKRICGNCSSNEVEDEIHVLLRCCKYKEKRKEIFDEINDNCKNFSTLSEESKFIYMLNSEDQILNCCLELVNYIFETRRSS